MLASPCLTQLNGALGGSLRVLISADKDRVRRCWHNGRASYA